MSDKLLLWLDFETTGLNAYSRVGPDHEANDTATDTVIEAAWMVTTGDLTQLTPLRSRIARLEPREPWAREQTPLPDSEAWLTARDALTAGADEDSVEEETGVRPLVVRMHEGTGLAGEFRDATSGTDPEAAMRLLTSGGALEQLILDDLAAARHGYPYDGMHVAGIGVSHFDQQLLAYHCPRLAKTNEGGILHYATFDPSIARRVVGVSDGGSDPEAAARMRERLAADLDAPSPSRMIEFDRPVRPTADDGRPVNRMPMAQVLREGAAHRAAADVVEGLAWAEWLRRKFSDALTNRAS